MQRKQIRDQLKSLLEPVIKSDTPKAQVFTFEKGIIERGEPAVSIYFTGGSIEAGTDVLESTAQLTISLLHPDVDQVDDQLDHLADLVFNTLDTNESLNGSVLVCLPTGWTYDRSTYPGWTGLNLNYLLSY